MPQETQNVPLETLFAVSAPGAKERTTPSSRRTRSDDDGLRASQNAGRATDGAAASRKGDSPSSSSSSSPTSSSSRSSHGARRKTAPGIPMATRVALGPAVTPLPVAGGHALAASPVRQSPRLSPRTMQSDDMVAAWSRPRVPHRYSDLHVNYIVLGESGLGKTTFIHNLISSFKVARPGRPADGCATTLEQFKQDPASLRTVLEPMHVPESSRRLIIALQDMPGWGEDLNLRRYLRTMISFILAQRELDYEQLRHARRVSADAMCGQLQHSITACLYFLPPHRVKKVDIIMMAAISQLVTVIPVISKSDTMTEPELVAYRAEVNAVLASPAAWLDEDAPGGGGCGGCGSAAGLAVRLFDVAPDVMSCLGVEALPLAVICGREQEPCHDEELLALVGPDGLSDPHQPVRPYAHGAAYPYSRAHLSDLISLKRLLLGDMVDSLYSLAEDSYTRYLAFCEAYEEAEGQLGALVVEACWLGRLLEYDDYDRAKLRLLDAKAVIARLKAANADLADRIADGLRAQKDMRERRWR